MPRVQDFSKWAVIACDQFTSQPEYWQKVREIAGTSPSAYRLILPEAMIETSGHEVIEGINSEMNSYLSQNLFTEYRNAYIYVERELLDGSIRRGIIGAIDLNEYDYHEGTRPRIRATEETVKERIPVRKAIRENASLELPHVILLADDERRELIEPLTLQKDAMKKLYDFELMLGGGNIRGWLVTGEVMHSFNKRLEDYMTRKKEELSLTFAVGDGNHSLAAAKACYEARTYDNPRARYAMVELENIYDDALKFEPIHRLVTGINPIELISALKNDICVSSSAWPIKYYSHEEEGIIYIDEHKGASALIVLQKYLDEHKYSLDYIHESSTLRELAQKACNLGLELPAFDDDTKRSFFRVMSESGTLPRKTFSMGHAQEKRYYLEARRIK